MRKILMLCFAVAVVALAFSGCATQAPPPSIDTLYLDPEYDGMGIEMIAILPLANTTGEADAEKIVGNAIEAHLATRTDYSFMTAGALRRRCSAAGLSPDLESLRRQWVHAKDFKPDLARKLASELDIDAFLVGEVSKWDRVDLRAEQSGYPHSDVGCRVLLMHARTGKKLWEGYGERMVKGPYYEPGEQEIGGYVDEAGIARGTGGKPVQTVEAPEIREVADRVAADVVRALPEKKTAKEE